MEIIISTLSENTGNFGYLGEWGLSMLIEADGKKILMDTGMGTATIHNAAVMNINFTEIDTIVLSHGHSDHTGGLRDILKRTGPKEIIAHPDIKTAKYSRIGENRYLYIGIPFSDEELESCGARFNYSNKPVAITDRITTTGEINMLSEYEKIDENLFMKADGKYTPDDLQDDLSLVINAEYGLVVVCGCAHSGIINIIRHAQKITGNQKIFAVVGGIHLFRAGKEQLEKTISALKQMDVQRLCVSHCTGFAASARLAQEFGNKFTLNNAGTRLVFPS